MNNKMDKVHIGIIGMGRMGITHYSIINSHPNVDIVSVSDTSKRTLEILKKNIPTLNTYTDYKTQIEAGDLDGIIVCTPPAMHYDICKMAATHGIAVFCEKPFTTSPDQAKELAEIFTQRGLVNQVGYVNRFNDMFLTTNELLSQGVIGDVIRFKSEIFSCTISKPQSGIGWRSKRENGGGVTYEMASHAIDLVNFIIGTPAKVAGATVNYVYSQDVEDVVSATLLYDNNTVGMIYANWCDLSYRKPSNKLEIFGTKGKIIADQHDMKLFLNEADPTGKYCQGWNMIYIPNVCRPVPFYVRGFEFTRQLYAFANSILYSTADKMACNFLHGYETQRVIHDIFTQATIQRK